MHHDKTGPLTIHSDAWVIPYPFLSSTLLGPDSYPLFGPGVGKKSRKYQKKIVYIGFYVVMSGAQPEALKPARPGPRRPELSQALSRA
jgi:hypothetical protein